MKFGNVEIPATLINALRENKVIVFAGAGVSMEIPANLPDFISLTRQILNLDKEEKFDNPDQKLGEGYDQGVKIHEQCIRILNEGAPQPTQLHHDILRLFPQSPKVITTNFDLLFEQAFRNNKPNENVKTYTAPVFPLGNNIEGIIYLHGSICDPRSMVLSDSDFGRAYLSESWAKRLLSDAFLNYDFIFVGYSYNDTILKYLTRALPKNRDSRLYAFANIEEGNVQQINHWKSLGIQPLIYQKENGTHQQLPQAIKELSNFLNLSVLDYERLITSKVAKYKESQLEETLDYIKFFLNSDDSYKQFYKIAQPEIWLKKIKEDQSLFDSLMKHENDFFTWIISDLDLNLEILMELLTQYSSLKKSQNLLWGIFRKLDDIQGKKCYWKWFLFLEKELYTNNNLYNGVHSWVLKKLIDFDLISEFGRAFGAYLNIQTKPDIEFIIKEYDFDSIIKIVKGKIHFHIKTISILIEKIEQYDNILKLYDQPKTHTAWKKKEIWEEDKSYSKELDYNLIHGILEIISEKKIPLGVINKYAKQCLTSEAIVLKRLGLYLLSKFSSYDADFIYSLLNLKIDWMDAEFRSEIFNFFELRYKNLSTVRKNEIISKIDKNLEYDYAKLKWFAWIYQFSPNCDLVKKQVHQLKIKCPNFNLEDKPYLAWRSSGVYSVVYTSPFTVSEIEARTDYIWYLALLEYDFEKLGFNVGSDFGYKGLWQEIVKANSAWLLDFLDFTLQVMPKHPIVVKIIDISKQWQFDPVIHTKFYDLCFKILSFKNTNQIYVLAQFLDDLHKLEYYKNDLQQHAAWIELAKQIITLNIYTKSTILGDIDNFTESLNSVNGALAWFAIKLYEQAKGNHQIEKQGEFLIKKIISIDENGYATVRTLQQYSFLKNRNSLFAQKQLLPLLFSKNAKLKIQAWTGFLANASLEYAEFREIHKDFYITLNEVLASNNEKIIKGLTDLYIYSIYFDYHNDAIESLRKLQRLESHIIAEQVLVTMRKIISKEDDLDKVWVWFREYLQDRIYQVNQQISKKENINNLVFID